MISLYWCVSLCVSTVLSHTRSHAYFFLFFHQTITRRRSSPTANVVNICALSSFTRYSHFTLLSPASECERARAKVNRVNHHESFLSTSVCVWWRKVGLDAGSPPPHAWLTDWLTYWQTKEKREWKKKKKRLSMTIKSASGESSRVRAFETLLLSFSLFNSLLLLSCIISQLCNRWWNGEFGERDGRWQSRLINSIVSFYLFCMVKTLL